MKKLYENPNLELVVFAEEEVLTASVSEEPSNTPTKDDQIITLPVVPAQ